MNYLVCRSLLLLVVLGVFGGGGGGSRCGCCIDTTIHAKCLTVTAGLMNVVGLPVLLLLAPPGRLCARDDQN